MLGACWFVAFFMAISTGTVAAIRLEDEDSNFAIRMRIRNGGNVQYGGSCSLHERDLILQAVRETVAAYHLDAVAKTDEDPWWCYSLCANYESEYCTVFHTQCPHPNDLMSVAPNENEVRNLANNRLVEIYEFDRQAHPSEKRGRQQKQSLRTKCHAAKVSALTRIRDELGLSVTTDCITFLRNRMDLSCFLVNDPLANGALTDGIFDGDSSE